MAEDWSSPAKDQQEFMTRVAKATAKGIKPEQVKDIYNKWAESYDQDMEVGDYPQARIGAEAVAELLGERKDVRILDAAAGTGIVGKHLHDWGYLNLDALDASSAMLEKARQKGVYQSIICDFLGPNRLDIEDDTYDVIVAAGCFAEGGVKHDCFPEIIRIIKPGGYFVLPIREDNLIRIDAYRDILEPAMDLHVEQRQWKKIKRQRVENFLGKDISGLIFVFEIL